MEHDLPKLRYKLYSTMSAISKHIENLFSPRNDRKKHQVQAEVPESGTLFRTFWTLTLMRKHKNYKIVNIDLR